MSVKSFVFCKCVINTSIQTSSFVIKRPTSFHCVHGFFRLGGMMKWFESSFFKSDAQKVQLQLTIWFVFSIYAYFTT